MRYSRSWPEVSAVLVIAACATGAQGQGASAALDPASCAIGSCPVPAEQDPGLVPAGFGSLRQDQVGVNLATPNLRIRVIPLDERVIRLLAPDAYRSLHDMREARAGDILTVARNSGQGDSALVFMVTFFGIQPQTRFNADDLLIVSQNATYRPLGRVALAPRFNEGELNAREQVAAIYLYDRGIALMRPFTVQFGTSSSDAWSNSLNTLNAERTRVLARAASQTSQP